MALPSQAAVSDDDIEASGTAASRPTPTTHEQILKLARDRFNTVVESESVLRQEQLTDKRFMRGDQWNERERNARLQDKRPCLTVNRLPQFKRQITGAARANRPDIQINPVDDHGDPEVAEVLQGLVKHIENISHAQVAYDTAVEDQVTMGRGYIRLITEHCDDYAFDLDIKIKRVRNAHSVYYDPRCVEVDYSDAMYAFVVTEYSVEEFNRQFPQADGSRIDEDAFDAIGDTKHLWFLSNQIIRVAEYFYIEFEDVEIALLSDGQVLPVAEAEQAIAQSLQELAALVAKAEQTVLAFPGTPVPPMQFPEPLSILKTRKTKKRVVKWAKINGAQVLKQGVWPGKWIPIVPVLGDEIDVDGRVDLRGMVRDARDQQRLYNFEISNLVELIGLAPKAPYIIASKQVGDFKKQWQTANTKSWAYLPYEAINVNGTYAPPPMRQSFEPAIAAVVAAIAQHDNDLKATTGFYDASLGERGPEQSGKAILARQKQGEIGSIHYTDNLGRALWGVGRRLLDLIPKIYDAPRVIRIIAPDETKRTVMVHAGRPDDVPQVMPPGVKKVYDLLTGRYDVVVGSGPGQDTRRKEAVEMMTAAIQASPELMGVIGDLYFGSMDWAKARQISERLKKFLPPGAQDDENGDDPNALKAQLGQLQRELLEKTAMLQEAAETVRTDKIKALHQKEVALLNAKVELIKLQLNLVAGERKTQMTIAAGDRKTQAQIEAGDRKQTRDIDARTVERQDTRQAEKADTILEAELGELDAERQSTEAERQRAEQRDDAREQRAFESQEAQRDREAQAQPQPGGGA